MNATAARQLAGLEHSLHRTGTFCLGGHLAPLFFILGAQRSGTASLYEDLMEHVRGSKRGHALRGEPEYYGREMHFFAMDTWSKGVKNYLDHFPQCPRRVDELTFTIDATPAHIRKPIVSTRLHDVYPPAVHDKLRFIIILRDPVDRIWSYWNSFVKDPKSALGWEADFARWTELTMDTVRECQRQQGFDLWPPPETGRCDAAVIEGVAAGLYAACLARSYPGVLGPSAFFMPTMILVVVGGASCFHPRAKLAEALLYPL